MTTHLMQPFGCIKHVAPFLCLICFSSCKHNNSIYDQWANLPNQRELNKIIYYEEIEAYQAKHLGQNLIKDPIYQNMVQSYYKKVETLTQTYINAASTLKPGDNIFQFHGILAKGELNYDPTTKLYTLDFGSFKRFGNSVPSTNFSGYYISFNLDGKILQIQPIKVIQ